MSIPGLLYDSLASPETLIATVDLTIQRRAEPIVARNKTHPWEDMVDAGAALSMRVICRGITSAAWIDTLIGRWHDGVVAPYVVVLTGTGEHAGNFMVSQLDETVAAEDRRRFSLTLRSSGAVAYTPVA